MKAAGTFRFIADTSEDGHCLFTMDAGTEQTSPYSPFRFSQNRLWNEGRYTRIAFNELGEGIRFKMKETAKPLYLFPREVESIPEVKKSGCPFADVIDLKSLKGE